MAKVKFFFATDSQKESETDRTKTRCPRIPLLGHKNVNQWINKTWTFLLHIACEFYFIAVTATYIDATAYEWLSIQGLEQNVDNVTRHVGVGSPQCVALTYPTSEVYQGVANIASLQSFIWTIQSTVASIDILIWR